MSQKSLWQSNFDRAHALRTSGQMGQRVEALKAIRAAAAIRPTAELGNEAIAAMALTDLEDAGEWLPAPTNLVSFTTAGSGERLAFSLTGGVIEVRRFPDGKLEASFNSGQQRPTLRLDDTGERLLTGDYDGSRVWDLRTTNLLCEVRTPDLLEGYRAYRMFGGIDAALNWHPGGNLLASVSWDHVLRLWDPFAGVQLLETTYGHPSGFSANGQWLLVDNERGIGRLKVHLPEECRLFHAPLGTSQNFGVVFSPDDRFVAGLAGDELWIWEVASGRRVAHQPMPGQSWLEFTSPRSLVATGAEGVLLWTNTAAGDDWALVLQTVLVPPGDSR